MIDEAHARELAQKNVEFDDVSLGAATETEKGWFFPWRTQRVGCNGVIINKQTGRAFRLGSAFPVERDIAMYDRGYQSHAYDLVILKIRDLVATRDAVRKLPLQVVEPTYEHGQVWRVPRPMTEAERRKRLDNLPCIFPALGLYFHLELLEEIRRERWFDFEALEYHAGPHGQ